MQLTITFLDCNRANALTNILKCITDCDCIIAELRSLNHSNTIACHLLIDGNWNHLAKLESSLSVLDQNHHIGLQMHRIDKQQEFRDTVPYIIEIFALDSKDILTKLVSFLQAHNITILEISSSRYPAYHVDSALFSSKLLIAISQEQPLIAFREEFLDYCDQLNIDAILEPLKSKTL